MNRVITRVPYSKLVFSTARQFSTAEASKNPLKIVRFAIPEFTPEIAQQLKKPVVNPLDTLPANVDREIVAKFPVLFKVFNKEMLPQDLKTYEERVRSFVS